MLPRATALSYEASSAMRPGEDLRATGRSVGVCRARGLLSGDQTLQAVKASSEEAHHELLHIP